MLKLWEYSMFVWEKKSVWCYAGQAALFSFLSSSGDISVGFDVIHLQSTNCGMEQCK